MIITNYSRGKIVFILRLVLEPRLLIDFESPEVEDIFFNESLSDFGLRDKGGGDGISQCDKFRIPSLVYF